MLSTLKPCSQRQAACFHNPPPPDIYERIRGLSLKLELALLSSLLLLSILWLITPRYSFISILFLSVCEMNPWKNFGESFYILFQIQGLILEVKMGDEDRLCSLYSLIESTKYSSVPESKNLNPQKRYTRSIFAKLIRIVILWNWNYRVNYILREIGYPNFWPRSFSFWSGTGKTDSRKWNRRYRVFFRSRNLVGSGKLGIKIRTAPLQSLNSFLSRFQLKPSLQKVN